MISVAKKSISTVHYDINDILFHIFETTCYEKNSVCISIKFPYNKSVPIHVHDTNATGIKGGRLQWNDEKGFILNFAIWMISQIFTLLKF